MSRLYLAASILFITFSATGQSEELSSIDEKNLRNEIGLNLFSITGHQFPGHYPYFDPFESNFLTGLLYKRHYSKLSLRVCLDYYYQHFQYENARTSFYSEGRNNIAQLRVGIERKLSSKKLRPYIAADFTFTYGLIKGTREGYPDFFPYPFDYRITEYGISPAIGVNYHFLEKFSLTLETTAAFVLYDLNGLDDYDYLGKEYAYMIVYHPIRQLSVIYHF